MNCVLYCVSPHDSINQPFILHQMRNGKLAVRPEFEDLTCTRCKKVNEKAALKRGVPRDMIVKSKRPILLSEEDLYLLDDKAQRVFSDLLPDMIDYYAIPNSSFFVASARDWMQPVEEDKGYRVINGRCQECGRLSEVYWSTEAPTIPQIKSYFCINMESRIGARETWIVTEEVASRLEAVSSKLSGVVLFPKEFRY
jgi:phage FluMu protein Com